jgi:hypothetical protein
MIHLETGEIFGQATKEERCSLTKAAIFLKNENIDIIQKIYQGKVENNVVQNLLDKMKSICEKNKYKDIYMSWLEFMDNLDKNNRKILMEYIL